MESLDFDLVVIGGESGFLKLLFRRHDMRVMGVQATELVHIGLIAPSSGGDAELFNRACFNDPTLGDLYKYATDDALRQTLLEKQTYTPQGSEEKRWQ